MKAVERIEACIFDFVIENDEEVGERKVPVVRLQLHVDTEWKIMFGNQFGWISGTWD